MRVLIVGGGGREHALAWKAAQSTRLTQLYIAPGNPGTAALGENVPIRAENTKALVQFAGDKDIDLVIVGPEGPLVAGLADELHTVGRRVFGPSQAAAEIEGSKAFAKAFMQRHGLPAAASTTFTDFYDAVGHLLTIDFEAGRGVAIKASGLAGGKGVILPDCADDAETALRRIMLDREFGAAGDAVVIEERLRGEEVSLLAFTDGTHVRAMPPAQDHKRLRDGDVGPNTGGLGAYAPAPACSPALAADLTRSIIQSTVDGLRAEGRPFVGVLYAGLIITADGPRVLEFNCRFGDPETQALLPLLNTDLLDVAEACATGRLGDLDLSWKAGAAACVVLASPGYPASYPAGLEITGLASQLPDAVVFHAGTREIAGKTVTAGGRVLGVTGWGSDISASLERAYGAVAQLHFDGVHYRTDIGAKARAVPA